MELIYKKSFKKSYKKLPEQSRKQVTETLIEFRKNPFSPKLKNHPLSGSMKGLRSISAGFDLRIVFQEFETYTVVYIMDVGTHTQIYNG